MVFEERGNGSSEQEEMESKLNSGAFHSAYLKLNAFIRTQYVVATGLRDGLLSCGKQDHVHCPVPLVKIYSHDDVLQPKVSSVRDQHSLSLSLSSF